MLDRTELEKQAESKFPYPLKCCVFCKKKIDWLRERWVKSHVEIFGIDNMSMTDKIN